jgi:acetyl-CoA synthetase (ADP-forming)
MIKTDLMPAETEDQFTGSRRGTWRKIMNGFENHPLHRITHPRSVAFWGASSNTLGMGSVQLSQLLALGFEGPVYPIHPTEKEILGLTAYSRIKDTPGPVDLAVMVLPTHVVPTVLEECGEAGVKNAIIVSAGFGEKGSDGKALQNQLGEIAKKYGICFLGPNCIGAVNPHEKLNTTFYPYETDPGFVGIASQSGSFVTQMFPHLKNIGLGFSQGFSVGNEAVVDLTDCLEYLGQCPNTKVIALYIEAIRRGRDFIRVAREVSKKKPIVAFYVGGSESGSRAGLSHTGALAGPDPLYNGVFDQCGIIRAGGMEELFDFCWVLGTQPLPRGNRIAVLTHSGGPGAAAADTADRCGLDLTEFSPETITALKEIVPDTASVANPVDLTFSKNFGDYLGRLPKILLKDSQVDGLFVYCLMPHKRVVTSVIASRTSADGAQAMAEEFIRSQSSLITSLSSQYGKPVVGGSYCDRSEFFVRELHDRGFPLLLSPERAVKALGALVRYARARRSLESE